MTAYYNENNPEAAAWLRELIKMGVIADGIVDDRSIVDVQPEDVKDFIQCHWFAGIGGWSYALRLAGIPDDQPIWTASLPCQPFSSAGKQLGKADERHLLPTYVNLVEVCRPSIQIGEQVPDAIRHGWLDDLYAEMEARGYACGAVIAGAHSVYAAHQRQRIYWLANSEQSQKWGRRIPGPAQSVSKNYKWSSSEFTGCSEDMPARQSRLEREARDAGIVGHAESIGRVQWKAVAERSSARDVAERLFAGFAEHGCISGMGDANINRRQPGCEATTTTGYRNPANPAGWIDREWIYYQDGKLRPFKSGIFPLVNGVPRRMVRGSNIGLPLNANDTAEAASMRIHGYGNAIVPELAAEFIRAALL